MEKVIELIPLEAVQEKLQKAEAFEPFVKHFLNNKKNVALFFEISVRVLNRWMEQEILKENVHYIIDDNKIIYLHNALFEFKLNPPSLNKREYKPHNIAKNFFK